MPQVWDWRPSFLNDSQMGWLLQLPMLAALYNHMKQDMVYQNWRHSLSSGQLDILGYICMATHVMCTQIMSSSSTAHYSAPIWKAGEMGNGIVGIRFASTLPAWHSEQECRCIITRASPDPSIYDNR